MRRRTEGRFRSVMVRIAVTLVIFLILLDIARASKRRSLDSVVSGSESESELEPLRLRNLSNSTESTIPTRKTGFSDEPANVSRIATSVDRNVGSSLSSLTSLSELPTNLDRPSRGLDNGSPVQIKDSYLMALQHSRNSDDPREGVVRTEITDRRDHAQSPVYLPRQDRYRQVEYSPGRPYPKDTAYHKESVSNSVSKKADIYSFGPSRPSLDFKDHSKLNNGHVSYGPPRLATSYGQPSPPTIRDPNDDGHSHYSYGEYSASSYLSPEPQQGYGPSSQSGPDSGPHGLGVSHEYGSLLPHNFGIPRVDFSWPFALKLNAFTLAKILLKLVIFKMIVKFIAVICLLLFIPKLEIVKKVGGSSNNNSAEDNDEEGGRRYTDQGNISTSDALNILTDVVTNSVKKYHDLNTGRSKSSEVCQSVGCRLGIIFASNETWRSYPRLVGNYVLEEMES